MAKKPSKVKLAKPAPHAGDTEVERIVSDANECSSHIWFEQPGQPGLHVMRFRKGTEWGYQLVRAIFCDDGRGLEWTVAYLHGSSAVLSEFNDVSFQKVKE